MDNEIKKVKIALYAIKGIKETNTVSIEYMDTFDIDSNKKIRDTCIEQYQIAQNITGNVYLCNITHYYLNQSKKLPMMYINVCIDRAPQKYTLYQVYLDFNITSTINTREDLLEKPIGGFFSLQLIIQNQGKELKKFDIFKGNNESREMLKDLTKTSYMIDLMKELKSEKDEQLRKKYNINPNHYRIPKNIIKLEDYASDDDSDDNSNN